MTYIYLHGFASGPTSKKAAYFSRRFAEHGLELRVPDLTEGDFEHLTLTAQLRVVEREAPLYLIGSSMGGYLAALYAARHPEVERVVLLAPAFGFARRWPESLGAAQAEEWRRTGWITVYHYAEQTERRIGYQLLEDSARYEDYPAVSQPALVFHGRRDTVVPCQFSVEFGARNPGARVEIIDSDHELVDQLDYLWGEVARFLRIDSPAR